MRGLAVEEAFLELYQDVAQAGAMPGVDTAGLLRWLGQRPLYVCCLLQRLSGPDGFEAVYLPSSGMLRFSLAQVGLKRTLDEWRALPQAFPPDAREAHVFEHALSEALEAPWPLKDLGSPFIAAAAIAEVFAAVDAEPVAVWMAGPWAQGRTALAVRLVYTTAHLPGAVAEDLRRRLSRLRLGAELPVEPVAIAGDLVALYQEPHVDLTEPVKAALASRAEAPSEPLEEGFTGTLGEVRVTGRMKAGPANWTLRPFVDPDLWTEGQRRTANVAALRLAAKVSDPAALGPAERAVLGAYSGWGGVSWQKIPDDVRPARAAGILYEYYTPTRFCRAVWHVLERLHEQGYFPSQVRALEPSAGIGRFIATGPTHLDWTAVELAPESAQLLRLLQPDVELHQTAFERFVVTGHGPYDLLVANPPYTGRGALLNVDPAGKRWSEEAHYFLEAGSRLLAPGGVMVQLVPLGALQGVTAIKLRETLLRRCRFLGAYMPPSELFPGARLNLCLQFWWKRPGELTGELSEGDKAILHGRYPLSAEGLRNTGGVWGKAARQGRRPGQKEAQEVYGTFDPEHLARMELRVVPPEELEAVVGMREAAHANVRRETATDRREKGEGAAPLRDDPMVGSARRLGARIHRFFDVARQDSALAEVARPELLADVQAWVAKHGNPHGKPGLRGSQERDVVAFLAAVKQNGTLPPALLAPAADVFLGGFRGRRDDLFESAEYMARQAGHVELDALPKLYTGRAVGSTETDPRWADWALVQLFERGARAGAWAMMPRQVYLAGDLYERLEGLGKGGAREPWQERLEARQREWLIEAINPLPMSDIDADLRSGWVPLEALEEYLTEANHRERPSLEWKDGYLEGTNVYGEEVWNVLAYINRESKVDEVDTEGLVSRRMRQTGEIEARIAEDKAMNAKFLAWLREHPRWQVEVADIYNRLFRGRRPFIPSSDPVPIARASGRIKLKPHQNNAIRTVTAMGGGLVGHDVGLGKTFFALGLVAWWRQQGKARRPLIVVPKQVLVNWLLEARRLLPDYDVLTIGVTEVGPGQYVEDSKATKARKWHEYAQGDHELCIVTMPAFLDVAVSPSKKKEIYERSVWFQREEALAKREDTYQEKLLQQQRVELDELRREKGEAVEEVRKGPRSVYSWERERDEKRLKKAEGEVTRLGKKIKKLEEDIAKREARLGEAPAGTRALEEARQAYEEFVARRELQQGDAIWWEDLGIDLLIIDEAQNFKNLVAPEARYGQVPKYLGAPPGDTKRCWDLFAKAQVVREQTEGTGIVLLTGTPLKNSPVELYTLLLYIRPQLWSERGIHNVEQFIDRYLSIEPDLVITPTGKVDTSPVVAGFQNLGELRAMLALIMDYRIASDVGLRVPEVEAEYIEVPMQDGAEELYQELREKAEEAVKSKTGETEEGEHYLSIIDKMHKAAQDLRLVDFELYQDAPTPPKYLALGERILRTCDYSGSGCMPSCAHIVFIDSVAAHNWATDSLVEQGIPRDRIARLQGKVDLEERQAIVDGLNGEWEYQDGRWVAIRPPLYDVVIGNSPVMAEGMNLQTRACGIHHLEMPWEPATVQQRNGRGVRQGNLSHLIRTGAPPDADLGAVNIYYYQTRRSFDAYRLQLVAGKREWQGTLLRGAEGSMNNPMAGAKMSADDWLLALAANPEQAKIRLAAVTAAHTARRLNRQRNEAATALIRYAGYARSIKHVKNPDVLFQYKREMSRLRDYLLRLPDDVFRYKDLIDRSAELDLYYEPGHDFAWVQGDVLCATPKTGSGMLRFRLLAVSSTQRAVTIRIEGEWFARHLTVDALWAQGDIAHDCSPWDPERDEKRRHKVQAFDWKNLSRVPDELLEADGTWLWENVALAPYYNVQGSTTPEAGGYPSRTGDAILFVPWTERKPERLPVWPTRAGIIDFLRYYQGDKKTRRTLLDGWFNLNPWQVNQIRREAGIGGEEEIDKPKEKPEKKPEKEKGNAARHGA